MFKRPILVSNMLVCRVSLALEILLWGHVGGISQACSLPCASVPPERRVWKSLSVNSDFWGHGWTTELSTEVASDGVVIDVSIMAFRVVASRPPSGLGFAPTRSPGMHLVSSWLIGFLSLCLLFVLS